MGCFWMVASMAAFAVEDAIVKAATESIPIAQVLVFFGIGGSLFYALFLSFAKEPIFLPEIKSRLMLVRAIFEITGRLFYVLSIAFIPLSVATIILQATPLVVIAGAVVVFGEKVGLYRWLAIIIGFFGVLIIVQPGTDTFSELSLLAVIGMIGFAGRDLASRAVPSTIGTSHLGLYGFLAVIVSGLILFAWSDKPFVYPDGKSSLLLIGVVVFGVLAYSCLMKAMRAGEVSVVTPFRYVRLLFGLVLGVYLFGETLTPGVLLGSTLIIGSGIFIVFQKSAT